MTFDLRSILDAISSVFGTVMGWVDSNPFSYFSFRTIVFLYVFFALYVLAVGLYRAHLTGALTKPGYIMGWPWIVIAAIVDFIANVTIFTAIFLEPPREFLVTTRLRRHLANGEDSDGWRWRVSNQICKKLLDYFDPRGSHCHPELMVDPLPLTK